MRLPAAVLALTLSACSSIDNADVFYPGGTAALDKLGDIAIPDLAHAIELAKAHNALALQACLEQVMAGAIVIQEARAGAQGVFTTAATLYILRREAVPAIRDCGPTLSGF